jgi:hypothetical protein
MVITASIGGTDDITALTLTPTSIVPTVPTAASTQAPTQASTRSSTVPSSSQQGEATRPTRASKSTAIANIGGNTKVTKKKKDKIPTHAKDSALAKVRSGCSAKQPPTTSNFKTNKRSSSSTKSSKKTKKKSKKNVDGE